MARVASALVTSAVISTLAGVAVAQQTPSQQSGSVSPGAATPSTQLAAPQSGPFDLGVDVSTVTATPAATHKFLLTLPPEEQQKMMADCQQYLADPTAATMQDTVLFCRVLV